MIKHTLLTALTTILAEMGLTDSMPAVDYPTDPAHGDYASNIALVAAKKLGKNPRDLAEEIAKKLTDALPDLIAKTEVAGPGFINVWIKDDALMGTLNVQTMSSLLAGKKMVVEYTDPNPFKEFHIGHLYSNIVGESVARLLQACGATVWKADYFGDVGMHVSKAIWGLLGKFEKEQLTIDAINDWDLTKKINYFGQAYAAGATAYEEDASAKEDMKELNFLIFKAAQEVVLQQFKEKPQIDYERFIKSGKYDYEQIKHIYELGREWSLAYFELIYKRLGTKFDGYYPESRTGEYGYQMVMDGLAKGVFEKGDGGAIIFPGSKHGLHERVFINSLGLPTYETKDFGNAVAKSVDFPYDQSLVVTGNEINDYFQVIIKALSLLNPQLGEKTIHLGHGMVRLPEGKMSSRTGKIKTGESLLDEAHSRAKAIAEDSNDDLAEMIGQAAIKYALLKQGIGRDVIFNFEESISFEGNSGPYLQYTYVRTRSVLKRAENGELRAENGELRIEKEERALLRLLARYPEIVEDAAIRYAPNVLCTYLFELAQAFNGFYQKHQIVKAPEESRAFRISLTSSVGKTLQSGLLLLGIKAPEKM